MKPLSPEVHAPLADWVKRGGVLVVCDDDARSLQPRPRMVEQRRAAATPRRASICSSNSGLKPDWPTRVAEPKLTGVGKGAVLWLRERIRRNSPPARTATRGWFGPSSRPWRARGCHGGRPTTSCCAAGPYVIAAGLDESVAGEPKVLRGRFVNLFDPELRVQDTSHARARLAAVPARPGSRERAWPKVLAAACKTLVLKQEGESLSLAVEGVGRTPAVVLIEAPTAPQAVTLAGQPVTNFQYSAENRLLWDLFPKNESAPRELKVSLQ